MIFTVMFLAVIGVLASIGLESCRKASSNGELDAQWQILKIENRQTGVVTVPATREYIEINLHVVQLNPGLMSANMIFDKEKNELWWEFPYAYSDSSKSRNSDSYLDKLARYGINENPVRLHIDHLSHGSLILSTPTTIITCRRF